MERGPDDVVDAHPTGGPAAKRTDWLTIGLVAAALVCAGFFLYSRRSAPGGAVPSDSAVSNTSPSPAGSPVQPVGPPPSPSGPQPGASPGSSSLTDFLLTPEGMVGVLRLHEQKGDVALKPDQARRYAAWLQGREAVRDLGSGASRLAAHLRPAQVEFMRKHLKETSGVQAADDGLDRAIAALDKIAGDAKPAQLPAKLELPPPEFDPQVASSGFLKMSEEGGDLEIQPAQAAALLAILRAQKVGMSRADTSDGSAILSEAQKTWLEKNKEKFRVEDYLNGAANDLAAAGADLKATPPDGLLRMLILEKFH